MDPLPDDMKNVTYKAVNIFNPERYICSFDLILLRQDVAAFIIQGLADVLGICGTTRNTLYGIMLLKLFMMKLNM